MSAHDDGRRLDERALQRYPGWTELQWIAPDGHRLGTQYRGPGGEVISRHEFRKRRDSGEIISTAASPTGTVAPDLPVGNPVGAPLPVPDPGPSVELPDPTPRGGRTPAGQASAAELALTATIALTILSSLLALVTQTPELQMTEQEANAIAVPVGNLFQRSALNRRFGRYLANSSDYTLLGYALYAYGFRVVTQLGQRQAQQQAMQQTPQRGYPYAVPQTAGPVGPAPAASTSGAAAPTTDERRAPASGGILGAISGANSAEAARIVGHNPIPNPRAS